MTATPETAALMACEEARCAALLAADATTLEALLAEDLIHIHLTGNADDKAAYMAGMRGAYRFHSLTRGALTIRLYGDVAVMTGPLAQQLEIVATGQMLDVKAMSTQVWRREGGRWLLTTCHNAPLSA